MPNPKVSLALLTRNGGDDLETLLTNVEKQEISGTLEIVAVDSGSTDSTLAILKAHAARIESISPKQFSFGSTRDLAFSLTTGEFIVTLSQDAVPTGPRWLEHLLAPFADSRVGAVSGKIMPWLEPRRVFFWERQGCYYFTRPCARWETRFPGFGFSNVNAAFRREVWERVRFGKVPMAEDKVFQSRMVAAGWQAAFAIEANVWHGHDYSFAALVKRLVNEGLGWRYAGEHCTWSDALFDLDQVARRDNDVHQLFSWGRCTHQIRTPGEFLFPYLRPVCEYLGYRFAGKYLT